MKISFLGVILSSLLAGLTTSIPAAGIDGQNVNGLNKVSPTVLHPLNRQALAVSSADIEDSEFPTIDDMVLLAYCLNYATEDSCANLFQFIHYYFLNKLQTDKELRNYLSDVVDTSPEVIYTATSVTSLVTTVIHTSYFSQDILTDEYVTITYYLPYSDDDPYSGYIEETDKTGEGGDDDSDINTDINSPNEGGCPSITLPLPTTDAITQTLIATVTETATITLTFIPTLEPTPFECGALLADTSVIDCISEVGYIQLDAPPTDCGLLDKYVGKYRPNFVNCFASIESTITQAATAVVTAITESGLITTITEAAGTEMSTVTESVLVYNTIKYTTTETDVITEPGSTITVTEAAAAEIITVTKSALVTITVETTTTETDNITKPGPITTITEAASIELATIIDSTLITSIIEITTTETDVITESGSTITVTGATATEIITVTESVLATTTIEATKTEADIITKPGPITTITITGDPLIKLVTVTESLPDTIISTSSIITTAFVFSTATETSLIYTRDNNPQEPKLYNSNSNNIINVNNIYPGTNNGGMLYGHEKYPENGHYPYLSSNGFDDYGGIDGCLVNYNGEEGLSTPRGIYFTNGTFVTFHVDCAQDTKREAMSGSRDLSVTGNKTKVPVNTTDESLFATIGSSLITGDNNIADITEYFTNTYDYFVDKDKECTETELIDEDHTEKPFIDPSKCRIVFITHPADCSELYPHGH